MSTATETDVRPVYLNGKFVIGGSTIDVRNPSNGKLIARMSTVGRDAVRKVFEDAQAAWPAWRKIPARDRGAYLTKIANILERRGEEIARTITLENGKPLAQSKGELGMTVDHLRWFAGEAGRAYGRVVANQVVGKRHMVVRTPVGVVGAIGPWNFPLVLAVRKVAPAMAAGCPVVLKSASATPLSCVIFAEAVAEAGVPPGVFQMVAGKASEIAAEMLENPNCRKITFTGSTEVGRELIRGAAAGIKKLSLELGGQAPLLVFADADLDQAVQGAIIAKFRNTGQSCVAANRVYVERSIYKPFVDKLVAKTKELKVGDGFEEGVEVGPVIDGRALEQALKHVRDAVDRGAKLLCGGKRWNGSEHGFFLEPTVLTDVPDNAICMCEETFAPVMPIAAFDDEAAAIREANNVNFGLAAYAFTRDISRIWRLSEQLEAGTIGINDAIPATSHCPFGGAKQSGWGRELGSEGIDAFLETKHISIGIQE